MSQLGCQCGGVISDVRYPSPTEGTILRQPDEQQFFGAACQEIAAFFHAVQEGHRSQWICRNFSENYPTDISDAEVVEDLICRHYNQACLSVCECKTCGRLHVQQQTGENVYVSFAPDDENYKAILKRNGSPI